MTVALSGKDIAPRIEEKFPGSVLESSPANLVVKSDSLLGIATLLKDTPGLNFNYLAGVTSVDYGDYFEVVYHLTSLERNHSLVLKTRCYDRNHPSVPSVVSLWKGADLQEREIYDLMGIEFKGHPNMKRIVLWDGFPGYPLRKDFNQWP